jgi:hypothetical protein
MGVLTTGNTFSTGDQVTASKLNAAVNSATLQAAAVDNTSTQLSSGAIIVKDLGITQDKIASDAVGTNQLANDVVVNTSGSITGAAGSFTTLAASGVVSVPDGSESVPSITNTGDTNTGIYFPTENSVALTAGAGARLTCSTSAITIDRPTTIVSTAQSDLTLQGGDANSKNLIFKKASAQQGKITAVGDELKFYAGTSGTETLELTTTQAVVTGNLGIGTASPPNKLSVSEASTDFAALITNSTSSGNGLKINAGDNSGDRVIELNDKDGNALMRVGATGLVGIGTASPTEKLQVVGHVRIGDGGVVNDDLILKGSEGIGPSSVGGSTSAAIITTNGIPTAAGHVGIEVPSNDNDDGFYVATDPNQTGTADLLALKINALGKVGIGETNPSAPLTVTSTTGGVLLPRMTTTQKNAISSPSNGEMVYDTDLNKFYGYANGSWVAFH